MRGLFTSKMLSIDPGHAVSGIADRARTLRILRGRVWITVEGIQHDYFLHAGDTFTAVPGRLTVVEADQEARIDVHRPDAKHALRTVIQWLSTVPQRLPKGETVQTSLKRHRMCDAC